MPVGKELKNKFLKLLGTEEDSEAFLARPKLNVVALFR